MVITPLLMLVYFWLFVDFNSKAMQVTFLEIAMPPMTMAVVLAIRGGLNKDMAINALALGILFSFLSIGVWHKLIL